MGDHFLMGSAVFIELLSLRDIAKFGVERFNRNLGMANHFGGLPAARLRVGDNPFVECEHELATQVVVAVMLVNGETAQFVTRAAATGGANCPNRLKRGQEAEQEVLSCLV